MKLGLYGILFRLFLYSYLLCLRSVGFLLLLFFHSANYEDMKVFITFSSIGYLHVFEDFFY